MRLNKMLEEELKRHLGRVSAPEELWGRLQNASHIPPKPAAPSRSWPVSVVLASILIGVALFLKHASALASDNGTLLQTLSHVPQCLEFRSQDAKAIHNWVKINTGLYIPGTLGHSGSVQLVGAHIFKAPAASVAIAYGIHGRNAMLLVSKATVNVDRDDRHHDWKTEKMQGLQVSSWMMGGQSYKLAYATEVSLFDACSVCHGQMEQVDALN